MHLNIFDPEEVLLLPLHIISVNNIREREREKVNAPITFKKFYSNKVTLIV